MITLSPIAALHADGRIQGDVQLAGTNLTKEQQ